MPPASPPPPPSTASLKPLLIACCIFLALMEALGWLSTRDLSQSPDFRAFYAAGYLLRTHPTQLYNPAAQAQIQNTLVSPARYSLPFYHPAYEALLYTPFTLLPYRPAYLTFIAFNILLLIAIVLAARPLFSTTIPFLQPRPGLIFFFFAPVLLAIIQGQDSLLFLLLAALTWQRLSDHRDAAAGCLLALALFRFQLALPIALLIALHRGRRFTAAFTATAAAVAALCLALTGPAGVAAWLRILSASSLSSNQGAAAQTTLAIHPLSMANLRGLLYACGTSHLPAHDGFAVVAAASAALLLVCIVRLSRNPDQAALVAAAVLCAVLVSYHLNIHDLTLLLLPLLLLANRVPVAAVLAAYCLPAVLWLFASADTYFLLALPTLALLLLALHTARAEPTVADTVIEHTPASLHAADVRPTGQLSSSIRSKLRTILNFNTHTGWC
jgi:hypothetical protein